MLRITTLLLLIAFALLSIVSSFYQRHYFSQLQLLQSEEDKLLAYNKKLHSQYATYISLQTIELQAIKSLDMVFPKRIHRL